MVNCIEPFEFETREADNVLVVEATITTVSQQQTIFLSRAANLGAVNVEELAVYNANTPYVPVDDSRANGENNAVVKIVDDQGNEFAFSEKEGDEGIYESDLVFAAQEGRGYQLQITTEANEMYESDFSSPIGNSIIQDIYAERTLNDFGEEGMAIYVDGSDSSNSSDYFRYTYEETYKIIAPNWTPLEFKIIRENQELQPDGSVRYPAVELVPRAQQEQVCYQSVSSTAINLVSTSSLETSSANRTLVRFISRDNAIISHRYSILVKQYLQSIDSYSYYQNLRNFTKSESVFSEVQPGFLQGNIKALTGDNIVIGFFDVASSAEKRLFFNYDDFFEGEELPPYFFDFNCDRLLSPCIGDPSIDGPKPPPPIRCPQSLVPRIKLGLVEFTGVNDSPSDCEGPFYVTPSICGDCTILGSNIVPEFWEE